MVPVYARRIKQVTLPEAGSRVECPRNINRLKKTRLLQLTRHEVLSNSFRQFLYTRLLHVLHGPLQWGAADAEIKVPSGENTEFKRSSFKGWSRLV